MMLSSGARIGVYEITGSLGAGGMGEVYRARDTKLQRDVAIKILPEPVAADVERLARFEREARTLASLNHPQIAQIYGFEQSGSTNALVMELVDGEDLSRRIARSAIPLDEALPIARQIAEALEAAHEAGIIHRDLKPANIKVRSDGVVKVLDFGLAKALAQGSGIGDQGSAGVANSPTITSPAMTQAGMILGTAAYMAPEQAKGREADKRSDIWAFGCVLFEMLTGTRPFEGTDVSDTLAAILRAEPDWTKLPSSTPAAIRRLLPRCLAKERKHRIGDATVLRLEIEEAVAPAGFTADGNSPARRSLSLVALALFSLASIAAIALWARPAPAVPEQWQLEIVTPLMDDPAGFALSPDGRQLAFAARTNSGLQLWIRALDDGGTRALAGTDDARMPFWSPDNRSLAFFAGTRLKRIDLETGEVRVLANVITPAGGAWSSNGTILFSPNSAGGLFRVSAEGGTATPLRGPEVERRPPERFPQFLPDGRRFIYFGFTNAPGPGVYLDDLQALNPKRLIASENFAVYMSGHLLTVRQNALIAQPFDAATGETTGNAIRLADVPSIGPNRPAVAVSNSGVLALRTGVATDGGRGLFWFDRKGQRLTEVGAQTITPRSPELSPDGSQVAFQDSPEGSADVWLIDLERDVLSRFTTEPGIDALPIWSPDGTQIVFNSMRRNEPGLYIQRRDGSTAQRLLPGTASDVRISCDWSPDGRFLLYKDLDNSIGAYDLRVLPINPAGAPIVIAATPFDERDGQFSPDGKWVAFQSNESGRPEIYLQPFPGGGAKRTVSKNGGMQVRWNRAGTELFYVDPGNRLTVVPIAWGPQGDPVIGQPVPLFAANIAIESGVARQQYDVSPDGTRFLLSVPPETSTPAPITIVLNWRPPTPPR